MDPFGMKINIGKGLVEGNHTRVHVCIHILPLVYQTYEGREKNESYYR